MNAVRKHVASEIAKKKPVTTGEVVRSNRYDSPRQEEIVKYVLQKHKVAFRELAK